MNAAAIAALLAAVVLAGCAGADAPEDPRCPAASRLIPGAGSPTEPLRCVVTVTCKESTTFALRCSSATPDGGTGPLSCECSQNGVAQKTIGYEDVFCGAVAEGKEAEAAEAARSAMAAKCGFDVD